MPAPMPLLRYIGATALSVAAILVGLANMASGAEPGEGSKDLFAVDVSRVLELYYRSPSLRINAYRWKTGDRYVVLVANRRGADPESCRAGPGFEKVLAGLTSLKMRAQLDPAKTDAILKNAPLDTWSELIVRDDAGIDPFRALLLPPKTSTGDALVRVDSATFTTPIDPDLFKLLSAGCKALGPRGRTAKPR